MSLAQIKKELNELTVPELDEITAYLFHFRHRACPEYEQEVEDRIHDRSHGSWLTLEQFEQELQTR